MKSRRRGAYKHADIEDACEYCGATTDSFSGKEQVNRNAMLRRHKNKKSCQFDYSASNRRYEKFEKPCPDCGITYEMFAGRTDADRMGKLRRHKNNKSCLAKHIHPITKGQSGVGYCFETREGFFKFGIVRGKNTRRRFNQHRSVRSGLLGKGTLPYLTPFMKEIGKWEKSMKKNMKRLERGGFVKFRKHKKEILYSFYLQGCFTEFQRITKAHIEEEGLA